MSLLEDLQDELGLTYLFIAHDLSAVQHLSDRVAVMYLGRIAEIADRSQFKAGLKHPYAESLLSGYRFQILSWSEIELGSSWKAMCPLH